jgi:hypothetical protein
VALEDTDDQNHRSGVEERNSVLKKAVIPAAGLGTRLLSVTKEQPKELPPVFAKAERCRRIILMLKRMPRISGLRI